jgi:uncharacterized UBP type Zn finger protein
MANCTHADQVKIVAPTDGVEGCEECLKIGGRWVHLRICLTCGKVGCCDNSPNKHARAHYGETKHPLIQSVEPGEKWAYCYEDRAMMREAPPPKP